MSDLAAFKKFHAENPHIYQEFCRLAFDLKSKGVSRCSHWLILNQIRWNKMVATKTDSFKISNNHFAFYARMFLHNYPEYDSFFKIKALKDD